MAAFWPRTRRLVLRDRFAEKRIGDLGAELGWPRREEYPADPEEGTDYRVVWSVAPMLSLHYFQDEISRHSYLVVVGADAAAVRATAALAESRLDIWRLDELLAEVDAASGPEGLATAVVRAGLGCPEEFDERFFSRLHGALRHLDPRVRERALWAVSYVPWPSYRPQLSFIRENDAEVDLRGTARILLEALDEMTR
jgi:hypothetical protein